MDTATVKIKVDTSSVEASAKIIKRDFQQIINQAKGIDTAVKSMQTNLDSFVKKLESVAKKSQSSAQQLETLVKSLTALKKETTGAISSVDKYVKTIQAATTATQKNIAATEKQNQAMTTTKTTMASTTAATSALQYAIATLATTLSVAKVIEYADAWLKVTNIVRLGTETEKELIATRQKLYKIAQDTRTEISAQTTLYNRLAMSQKDLGITQKDMLNVIQGVGKALGVTATSALESRGSLIQLAQAFGQGTVRAEEFNSIMEGTPRIAKAAADGLGLTRSELRTLVLEGKLSSQQLFVAIQSQLSTLDAEFAKVTPTISSGFNVITNALTKTIGEINELTGASTTFVNFAYEFAEALKNNKQLIIDLAGEISELLIVMAGSAGLSLAIKTLTPLFLGLTAPILGVAAAMNALNLAFFAFGAAYVAGNAIKDFIDRNFGDTATVIEGETAALRNNIAARRELAELPTTSKNDVVDLADNSSATIKSLDEDIKKFSLSLDNAEERLEDLKTGEWWKSWFGEGYQSAVEQATNNVGNYAKVLEHLKKQKEDELAIVEASKKAQIEVNAQNQEAARFATEKANADKNAAIVKDALTKKEKEHAEEIKYWNKQVEDGNRDRRDLYQIEKLIADNRLKVGPKEVSLMEELRKGIEAAEDANRRHYELLGKNAPAYQGVVEKTVDALMNEVAIKKKLTDQEAKRLDILIKEKAVAVEVLEYLDKYKAAGNYMSPEFLDYQQQALEAVEKGTKAEEERMRITGESANAQATAMEIVAKAIKNEVALREAQAAAAKKYFDIIENDMWVAIHGVSEMSEQIIVEDKEYTKELEKETKKKAKIYKDFVDDIQDEVEDVFQDMFDGTVSSWKDMTDVMEDYFKKMLAKLAAEMVTTNLVVPFLQSIGITATSGLSVTEGGSVSLLGSGGSLLGGLGNLSNLGSSLSRIGTGLSNLYHYGSWSTATASYAGEFAGIGSSGGVGGSGVTSTAGMGAGSSGWLAGGAYAIYAYVGARILAKMFEDSHDASIGLQDLDTSSETYLSGHDQAGESGYMTWHMDLEESDADYKNALVSYFDAKFTAIDDALNLDLAEVLSSTDWMAYVELKDYEDIDSALAGLSSESFKALRGSLLNALFAGSDSLNVSGTQEISTGWDYVWVPGDGGDTTPISISDSVGNDTHSGGGNWDYTPTPVDYITDNGTGIYTGTTGPDSTSGEWVYQEQFATVDMTNAEAMFGDNFFENIAEDGEDAWDTFQRFGTVMESYEDPLARMEYQMTEFGISAEEAYGNLELLVDVFDTMEETINGIMTNDTLNSIRTLGETWDGLLETLTNAHATTEEIDQAQQDWNLTLGSTLTGLNANSLATLLLGDDPAGDIRASMNETALNVIAGMFSETLMDTVFSPILTQIGSLFEDMEDMTPEQFSAAWSDATTLLVAGLDSIDWDAWAAATEQFRAAADEALDAVRDWTEELLDLRNSLQSDIFSYTMPDGMYDIYRVQQEYLSNVQEIIRMGGDTSLLAQAAELRDLQIQAIIDESNATEEQLESTEKITDLMNKAAEEADVWGSVADSFKALRDNLLYTSSNPANAVERLGTIRSWLDDNPITAENAEEVASMWEQYIETAQEAYQRPSVEYQQIYNDSVSALEELEKYSRDMQQEMLDVEKEQATLLESIEGTAETLLSRGITSITDALSWLGTYLVSGEDQVPSTTGYSSIYDMPENEQAKYNQDILIDLARYFQTTPEGTIMDWAGGQISMGADNTASYIEDGVTLGSFNRTTPIATIMGIDPDILNTFMDLYGLTYKELLKYTFGGYEDGTDYVPRTGIYELHEGERVLTKEENSNGVGGIYITMNISSDGSESKEQFEEKIVHAIRKQGRVRKELLSMR